MTGVTWRSVALEVFALLALILASLAEDVMQPAKKQLATIREARKQYAGVGVLWKLLRRAFGVLSGVPPHLEG